MRWRRSADEIALDDPDFWQKLMPGATAAEKAAGEAEVAEEAQRLVDEEVAAARVKDEHFEWTWAECKRVLFQLTSFGFGLWEAVHAAAKLRPDKTPSPPLHPPPQTPLRRTASMTSLWWPVT
jgi:hypothetical protein